MTRNNYWAWEPNNITQPIYPSRNWVHGYYTNHVDIFLLSTYQIKLKKVLGLTVCSNAALDVSPTTGVLAYPAG